MTDITHMTLRQMKDSLRNASPRSKHEFNLLALKHGQRNVLLGGSAAESSANVIWDENLRSEFFKKVKVNSGKSRFLGSCMTPESLLRYVRAYHNYIQQTNTNYNKARYGADYMLGFALALQELETEYEVPLAQIVLECKKGKKGTGKDLDVDTSWAKVYALEHKTTFETLSSESYEKIFMIDQGGGSFTAYLYEYDNETDQLSEKGQFKSKTIEVDTYNSFGDEETISKLINAKDGTFKDYSSWSQDLQDKVTEILGRAYQHAYDKLNQTGSAQTGSARVLCLVAQTGKIREKLMQAGQEEKRAHWTTKMENALKTNFKAIGPQKYELLTNEREAQLEATAFANAKSSIGRAIAKDYVALGTGSSSTQAYGVLYGDDGKETVVSSFNTSLGVKPSEPIQETSAEEMKGRFLKALLGWQTSNGMKKEVTEVFNDKVGLITKGAIGYAILNMCDSKPGDRAAEEAARRKAQRKAADACTIV